MDDKYPVRGHLCGDNQIRLQLPSDVTCSQCVVQRTYKTGKSHVQACNSTRIIIIINAVAVIAIITFIFCFSDLLIWLVLLRHVIRLGLLLLGRLIDWSAVPCDADGFFLTCEDFRGMFDDSVPACIKKKKKLIPSLPTQPCINTGRGLGEGMFLCWNHSSCLCVRFCPDDIS